MPLPSANEPSPSAENESVLDGVIERITFHNAENGYSVVKIAPSDNRGRPTKTLSDDLVTVLGHFTNPVVGESIRAWGEWTTHPQYGAQFRLHRYETLRPATAAAIEKYLGSGMVKGIGPKMAARIVAKFGSQSLEVIEKTPEKLAGVSGLGGKRIDAIKAAWDEQREVRTIMLFLQGHGVTPTYAVKIYRAYKERSIEIVERNPYQLATDIWGIGFKTADKIAQNIGIAPDAPTRLEAGLIYVLNQEVENGGHCYLPNDVLIMRAAEILGAEHTPIADALNVLTEQERLIAETWELPDGTTESAIYTPTLFASENGVAQRINALLHSLWTAKQQPKSLDTLIGDLPDAASLSDEQRAAVRLALSSPMMVMTGGPGVGKTFTTRAIVAALEANGRRIQLASPTGRAAKRLAEVTQREAKTIHRLLSYDPETHGFKHNADQPLDLDVLIIDESSMLDTTLTYHCLRAVPDTAQVIFVGDVDQLPSVGAGNILADLILSEQVPVARLTKVFRQAAQSRIITNAHAINQGRIPLLADPSEVHRGADCVFVAAEESDTLARVVANVVSRSLPKLGYTADDITILTPMQRGSCGARHLNEILQQVLNPPHGDKAELRRGALLLRLGDRVLQRVNNYDKNVFNGDVGKIVALDLEEQILIVEYPEGAVEYDFADADQLTHAFGMTVHKAQGSEYLVCLIVLHTQHYMMLQRNVIYTALTRARKLAVFVGSKRAIAMAVNSETMSRRNTRLSERLRLLTVSNSTPRRPKKPQPLLPLLGRLL